MVGGAGGAAMRPVFCDENSLDDEDEEREETGTDVSRPDRDVGS